MRFNAILVATAALGRSHAFSPFQPIRASGIANFKNGGSMALFSSTEQGTVCDKPDVEAVDLVAQKASGITLRESMVTNVDGKVVSLGDAMGDGTSVVVFLRHLA